MKTYLVGGAVRDELLGRDVHDRDYVVTGATVEQMLNLGYQQVGADFPVFLHPQSKEEHALARTERKSGQGYKGFTVDFNPQVTLQEDLLRRDLTVNAIAKDENGDYYDPYGGLSDIENRCLRHVSDAFVEDPLRVLRVARFAAQLKPLGFKVHADTIALMATLAQSGELAHLTAERVFKETEKALCSSSPETFFEVLHQCGALNVLFAEISLQTLDVGITALRRAVMLSELPEVRWAALTSPLLLQSLEQAKTLNQKLKVPNRYAQLSEKVVELHSQMAALLPWNEQDTLTLLTQIDAFRRPQLLQQFVLVCWALINWECEQPSQYIEGELLLKAYQICQQVIAKPFVEQGMKGIAIKQAIEKQRLTLLAQMAPQL